MCKITAALLLIGILQCSTAAYVGKLLGKLSELHHGVSGEVYAVDARTLHIKDFTYDGEGPAAYFYVGASRTPSNQKAFRVRDENGNAGVLKRYRRKSITLTLPEGKNLNNLNWFSVWCDEFAVNFGDVKIPRNLDYPKPNKLEALRGVHGISSDPIVIVDAQTILIPHLSYDGEAPDAKFWVGRGPKPSPQGIRVPDENGKEVPLRRYDRKTVVLTLPGDLTVFDIGHFGIWCEAFTVDFGHVRIPQQLNVPPSLKMLGVSPQSKLNCEVLFEEQAFEVRWAVAGDSIVLQLVSKIDNGDYMSFGISGHPERNQMIGGDVVVAWVDRDTMKGYAVDYFLQAKSQCSGPTGSCPDENFAENANNIRLLNAAMVNGYSIVTYQRPLRPSDDFDQQIYTNASQAVIWGTGPLNQRSEVSFHTHFAKKTHFIDFGRPPKWNCPLPENQEVSTTTEAAFEQVITEEFIPDTTTIRSRTTERRRGGSNRRRPSQQQTSQTVEETVVDERPSRRRDASTPKAQEVTTSKPVPTPKPVSNRNAWYIPPIQCFEPEDGVFYAQMGPTGGKRGYPAITGHVGWGVSWYINGLLIPEINVVRGKQYTFVVEGGIDPDTPARYHPFYITDDPVGGYAYKTPEERQNIRIFAGARQTRDNIIVPTGVGRLCHWTHTGDMEADDFPSFGAFQRTLKLKCDAGEPGVISWTPDENTPDTVYYQCFTHRYLGWKINVNDACDEQPEGHASAPEPSLALPDDNTKNTDGDLKSSPSIIVETRINPNDLFQTQQTSNKQPQEQQPDKLQNDHNDKNNNNTTQQPTTTTEKLDIMIKDSSIDTLNLGEILPINLTRVMNDSSDIYPTTHTRDKLLESQNNKDPLEITSMMFPAGRLPLEPQFPNLRKPNPNHRPTKPIFLRPNPNYSNKKVYYRVPVRRGPVVRPIPHVHPTNNIQNFALTKEPVLLLPPAKQEINISSTTPIATTEPTTVTPKLKPAINTGFHPETIVMENGFRPIISKEFEKRISENEEEPQDELGVIKTQSDNHQNSQTLTQSFEPMFIPSPLDNSAKKQQLSQAKITKRRFNVPKKHFPDMVVIVKESRSNDEVHSDDGDPMVMAAERIQSYYLPPDDKKIAPKSRKTNLDIPPGSVVTYDGITVSGTSLTSPVFKARSSQATNLRLTPQFGPFRGEKPPLNPSKVNIASISHNHGSIGRGLNAPETTRLSAVRYKRDVENIFPEIDDIDDVRGSRIERSPHHISEHTIQQKQTSRKYSKKFVFRTKRSLHHNGEHTEQQNKEIKKGRKIYRDAEISRRSKRYAHHTPEHTQEQKREGAKFPKKVGRHEKSERVVRSAHHNEEHTHEQKRESAKLPSKNVTGTQQKEFRRVERSAHHTPEHTHEQKRKSAKIPSKKVSGNHQERSRRFTRSAHHTPDHTHEQKRESAKLPSKKVIKVQHNESKRLTRSAHHTPEHTHEQKRESAKLPAKKVPENNQRTGRRVRSAHHTAEHTQEQKRESAKLPSKKVSGNQQKESRRVSRSAHHTPEHTEEQKRESAKLPSKKVSRNQQQESRRFARSAHHTPEHTHEQKREFAKLPAKKVSENQQKRVERVSRSAHHTPEHTQEQKRESAKLPSKKVSVTHNYKGVQNLSSTSDHSRSKRSPHHNPEHTAQQNMQKNSASKQNIGSVISPLLLSVVYSILIRFN